MKWNENSMQVKSGFNYRIAGDFCKQPLKIVEPLGESGSVPYHPHNCFMCDKCKQIISFKKKVSGSLGWSTKIQANY